MDTLFICGTLFAFLSTTTVVTLSSSQQMASQHENLLSKNDLTESGQYFFYQRSEYPRDCKEVQGQCATTNSSGVYIIKPDGIEEPFEVFCNHDVDTGGWTVIQRREDGYLNFNRSWSHYKSGFGFLSTEFWLGNEKLSYLTNQGAYELRVDIQLSTGTSFYTIYKGFRVADEFGQYKLSEIGPFESNAGLLITTCPENMVYQTCTCQTTCDDPNGETGCHNNCSKESCVCPEGYKINGSDCIHMNDCGCFLRETNSVLPNGESYVNDNCTLNCSCDDNTLECNTIACDINAACIPSNGARECSCNEGFYGDGQICETVYTDCKDVYDAGNTHDGIFTIQPNGWTDGPFTVFCRMDNGGGWTVFQRRGDHMTDFYRDWNEYRDGFGDLVHFTGDFWLGNSKLYFLTIQRNCKLRFDVTTSSGSPLHAEYSEFQIENEDTNFKMNKLGSHSGNTGNSLWLSRGRQFSTRGSDNDACGNFDCAEEHRSGWWHSNDRCSDCYFSACRHFESGSCNSICTFDNLNGDYNGGNGENVMTGCFYYENCNYCNLRSVEMKVGPSS